MEGWEGLIKPLNCNSDDMPTEWQLWKRQLETWFKIKRIRGEEQKLNYLRLLGGIDLQKICLNLQMGEDANEDFESLMAKLDGFFIQPRSLRYERYVFRQIIQKENEKFDSFLLRMKRQALKCGWPSMWTSNENIADQVVAGCRSGRLRARLMEKDSELEEIIAVARSMEAVEVQKSLFEEKPAPKAALAETVAEVTAKSNRFNSSQKLGECFRCGKKDHLSNDINCPAKGRSCNNCGKSGHFAIKCMTRKSDKPSKRTSEGSENKWAKKAKSTDRKGNVNKLVEETDSEEESGIAGIFHLGGMDKIECKIGGVSLNLIIDSGAAANVISEGDWQYLQRQEVKMLAYTDEPKKKLTGYGSDKSLELLAGFRAQVVVQDRSEEATFYVVKNGKSSLLGNSTAKALGVLRVGLGSDKIGQIERRQPFPKLKGFKIKLTIDENVPPVFQAYRRIPISLEGKVQERIQEMLDNGVTEKVSGYSRWASPLVIVPKKDGDIRVCVDLRRPNMAILYENIPFTTTEELMPKLKGAKVFSKIDGKDSYHQAELDEESRELTTFIFKGKKGKQVFVSGD